MPSLLSWLSLPEVGLGAVFLISLLASTLLPLGSEPALLAYVALTPSAVWLAIGVATLGNTLGGVITYWMGVGARRAFAGGQQDDPAGLGLNAAGQTLGAIHAPSRMQRGEQSRAQSSAQSRAHALAQRFGAPVLLFSWLPLVGDPLCGVAGWMRLPFLPCLIYIALGKCARYALICGVLLHFFP